MSETDENRHLREKVERQAERMKQAEQDRPTLLAHTIYLGTLGLLFVLPVVFGAYLGLWLDEHFAGYSIHWTVTMILLGVFVGAVNVYLFIRDR
jgi:ATP synthase protein I